ncbi:MAG: hypothetical protein ACLT1J_00925 [Mediterraneibacter gnavus]
MYDENSKPVLDEMGKQRKKLSNRGSSVIPSQQCVICDVQQTSGEPLPALAAMLERKC